MLSRHLSAQVVMLAISCGLAACGGGDEEEEEDFEPADASAAGIYRGTLTMDGGASSAATLTALDSGSFVLVSSAALFKGTGETNGIALSASGTGYAGAATFQGGALTAPFTFTGTVSEGSRIAGSFTGGGLSGTFSLDYMPTLNQRSASLAAIQGNYSVVVPSGSAITGTLQVSANGSFTYQVSNGCSATGPLAVAAASGNTYSWSANRAGCTNGDGAFNGLAYMDGASILVMSGASATAPWAFASQK